MPKYLGPNAPKPAQKRKKTFTKKQKGALNINPKSGFQQTPKGVAPVPGFEQKTYTGNSNIDPNARFKQNTTGGSNQISPADPKATSVTAPSVDQPADAPTTTAPTAPDTPKTYAEQSKDILSGQYATNVDVGDELGLDTSNMATSLGDYLDKYSEQKEQQKSYLELQQGLATQSEESQFGKSMGDLTAADAANAAAMAQGREGFTSSGAPMATTAYSGEIERQRSQLEVQKQSAEASRAEAMRNLEQAQQTGDENLIQAYSGQLASIEGQLRQIDTDALNAATAAVSMSIEEQANTRANMASFTTMVDSGQEMTMESLSSMAATLNVPLEAAFGYYQGAENIRNDKNLDEQTKLVELEQLKVELNNTINGVITADAQNAEYIKGLYQSGASDEEISNVKQLMGINDADDPMFQAELRSKNATTALNEYKLAHQGEPPKPGTKEYAELQILENELLLSDLEVDEMRPGGGSGDWSIDNMDTRAVNGGASNGSGRVDPVSYFEGYDLGGAQRGDTVNDSSGNSLGTITSPYGADHSHISGEKSHNGIDVVFNNNQVSALNSGTIVKTGNSPNTYGAYVWVADGKGNVMQYGHVNVDQMNGLNVGDKIDSGETFIEAETDSSKWGSSSGSHTDIRFVGEAEENKPVDTVYSKFVEEAKSLGIKGKEDIKKFADDQIEASYKPMTESQGDSYSAYVKLVPENEHYIELTKDLDPEDFADSINIVTNAIKDDGLTAQVVNNNIDDPIVRQAIMSEMRWIEGKLRKESGAAISAEEYSSNGTMYFPRTGDDEATIAVKEQRRKDVENGLVGQMGPAGTRLYEETQGQGEPPASTDPSKNPYMIIDTKSSGDVLSIFD